jgi:hypothetical protein
VVNGNEVWVLYGRTHDTPSTSGFGNLYAIRVAHSSDGGQSVDARYDALDPTLTLALHPRFTRDAAGGLDVVYYTGTSEGDAAGSVRASRSIDGGASFGPSVVLHEPVTFTQSRTVQRWIGEYFGVTSLADNLYAAVIDNSGSESHVAFHRTPVP